MRVWIGSQKQWGKEDRSVQSRVKPFDPNDRVILHSCDSEWGVKHWCIDTGDGWVQGVPKDTEGALVVWGEKPNREYSTPLLYVCCICGSSTVYVDSGGWPPHECAYQGCEHNIPVTPMGGALELVVWDEVSQ